MGAWTFGARWRAARKALRTRRLLGLRQAAQLAARTLLGGGEVRVTPRGFTHPVRLRAGTSDEAVFRETFMWRELDLAPGEARIVIDAGANIGMSAVFLARRWPRATIIAVEPDPGNLALLRDNVAGYPNVRVVAGGLWSQRGHLRIVNRGADNWSFRCEPAAPEDPDSFEAHTVASLLDDAGASCCDLLKMDIEGAEAEVLAAGADWADRVRAVMVELHGARAEGALAAIMASGRWRRSQAGEKALLERID